MTATHASFPASSAILRGTASRAARRIVGLLSMLAFTGAAFAENVLEDITYSPGAGAQVDVAMKLAAPPVDPKVFTTDAPARIAIDFEVTRNAVAQRRINVVAGATSGISAVEAAGRTRVVIELSRPSGYTTRIEGNNLLVSIGGGAERPSSIAVNDPTKASRNQAPQVAGIDF